MGASGKLESAIAGEPVGCTPSTYSRSDFVFVIRCKVMNAYIFRDTCRAVPSNFTMNCQCFVQCLCVIEYIVHPKQTAAMHLQRSTALRKTQDPLVTPCCVYP